MSDRRLLMRVLLGATCLASASPAAAQFTTPFVSTTTGSETSTVGGKTFTNQGLFGAGRFDAEAKDKFGDTIGSFSGISFDAKSWRRSGDSYSGSFFVLPDRGYNGGVVATSNYAARLHRFDLNFTPYTGTANLPAATSSQNQVRLTYRDTTLFTDFNGQITTGVEPANGFITQGGVTNLPSPASGLGSGRISLDSEAVVFAKDGTFYVGDEYGANIYRFNRNSQLTGVIKPPESLIPRNAAGVIQSNSTVTPATGRRQNQGFEGVSISPDGKKLYALLQSAPVQDTTDNQATRLNTRLLVYDISGAAAPTVPSAHYVLQLPTFTLNGAGGAANRTAAQSEILALNDRQFLVLSRDGNGWGPNTRDPFVFKNILVVDIGAATNIAGTSFENSTTPLAPAGVRNASVTPVQSTTFVNILNTPQLNKFGLNINNAAGTRSPLTLSEKWEALALVPVLDERSPQDYFLFVTNDNDFMSRNTTMTGNPAPNTYNAADAGSDVNNDNLVLVYRLTLPTYVNPVYLDAARVMGPVVGLSLSNNQRTGLRLASGHVESRLAAIQQALGHTVTRQTAALEPGAAAPTGPAAGDIVPWASGSYRSADRSDSFEEGSRKTRNNFTSGAAGVDYFFNREFFIGVAAGYVSGDVKAPYDIKMDTSGGFFSAYGGVRMGSVYANLSATFGFQDHDRINRPDPYGLTARGKTSGDTRSVRLEAGYDLRSDAVTTGPIASIAWANHHTKGFTEEGAAGGNIRYPSLSANSLITRLGWQASYRTEISGMPLTPALSLAWERENSNGVTGATLGLASVDSDFANVGVRLPTQRGDYFSGGVGLSLQVSQDIAAQLGYSVLLGDRDLRQHSVVLSVGVKF